jgi:hypothetical protein
VFLSSSSETASDHRLRLARLQVPQRLQSRAPHLDVLVLLGGVDQVGNSGLAPDPPERLRRRATKDRARVAQQAEQNIFRALGGKPPERLDHVFVQKLGVLDDVGQQRLCRFFAAKP